MGFGLGFGFGLGIGLGLEDGGNLVERMEDERVTPDGYSEGERAWVGSTAVKSAALEGG